MAGLVLNAFAEQQHATRVGDVLAPPRPIREHAGPHQAKLGAVDDLEIAFAVATWATEVADADRATFKHRPFDHGSRHRLILVLASKCVTTGGMHGYRILAQHRPR